VRLAKVKSGLISAGESSQSDKGLLQLSGPRLSAAQADEILVSHLAPVAYFAMTWLKSLPNGLRSLEPGASVSK
jgi:hypothetical protein